MYKRQLQERLQSTRQSLHIYMCWSAGQATSKRSSRSVLRTRCYDRLQPVYSLLQPVGWLRAHRPKRPRQTVWYLVRRRCVCSLDGRCCSGHYSLLQPVASCYSLLQPVTAVTACYSLLQSEAAGGPESRPHTRRQPADHHNGLLHINPPLFRTNQHFILVHGVPLL